jgi:hypothetical protein
VVRVRPAVAFQAALDDQIHADTRYLLGWVDGVRDQYRQTVKAWDTATEWSLRAVRAEAALRRAERLQQPRPVGDWVPRADLIALAAELERERADRTPGLGQTDNPYPTPYEPGEVA